jgi:hypothetical protein
MGGLVVRVGVALGTGVTGCCVLTVVKVYVGWQGGFAHPAQGISGVAGCIFVGCRMQGSQPGILGQDMQVALQASAVCRHAGACGVFGPIVACHAGHGRFVRLGVAGVGEWHRLHGPVRPLPVAIIIHSPQQSQGEREKKGKKQGAADAAMACALVVHDYFWRTMEMRP